MLRRALLIALALSILAPLRAAELKYKDQLLPVLVKQVPGILKTYDAETGRFGTGIWICNDQNRMYPLAAAYAYKHGENPYYKDKKLLDVIMAAGDALIDDADENGQWVFRKKDGSTWGKIWMPWTYSRWARAFNLIRDDMPADRRQTWAEALTLGFTGINKKALGGVHNIPTHHAMGLYVAGKALDRPEWCRRAAGFFMKVVAKQAEGGYWSENVGPVVGYNFVYVDALGTYFAMSGDKRVLPALEKAAAFHRHFTYPDGRRVETIDERNPYKAGIDTGNVGFTFTPVGRAYLQNQWSRYGLSNLSADLIASLLLFGAEGAIEQAPPAAAGDLFVLTEGGTDRAATLRHGPWFVCVSAYTAPIPKSRWIQDRQNLVSIYHDKVGLILGGGNTKLQPAWSNFTVGETTLLKHTEGDTKPNFIPRGKLFHVPSAATLIRTPDLGLDLTYGPETCRVRIKPLDPKTLEYHIQATTASDLPVAAHLTLLPHLGKTFDTAAGQRITLTESPISLTADEIGGAVTYMGFRLRIPKTATLHGPVLPHNPYRKDGRAGPAEGRIEIRIPFDPDHTAYTVTIEILK